MYYGEDLFDEDVDDVGADRVERALTHVVLGAFEAVAWLLGAAIVGAVVGTDLESSPWFWVVLIALPLIVGVALWLRRTRIHERVAFDPPDRERGPLTS
jgi:F0F1-type ATP synthase assembly protein I